MKTSSAESNRQVVSIIENTELYQNYARAFREVTGLPLMLQPMHGDAMPESCPQSAFCRMLNAERACRECRCLHNQLMREAGETVVTKQCAMGLWETAIPVRFEGKTVALLKTGQVRRENKAMDGVGEACESGGANDIRQLITVLKQQGLAEASIEALVRAYEEVAVVDGETYQNVVTMLAIFSLHLTTLIGQLALAQSEGESTVVTEAKKYIADHLDEKLVLERVAEAVNVSVFYFCKLFKQATGMTFTEYVNRQRIALAKEKLSRTTQSITEVAFDVGYQSLSQFNRCFLRYVGESPSSFRKKEAVLGARAA